MKALAGRAASRVEARRAALLQIHRSTSRRQQLQLLSEAHVKEALKPSIETFRNDHSRVTLDGPDLTEDERRAMVS